MNPQSTDRTAIDSNQFIPRVLYQGSFTVTTDYSNPAYPAYYGSNFVDLQQLRIDANAEYDIWVKPPSQNRLYKLPVNTIQTANGVSDWIGKCWLSRVVTGETFSIIGADIFRNTTTGSLTDEFTFYYTFYTTKVTDDDIL